jgi:hypothetical protein
MGSRRDKFWAWFEDPRDARPLALFRIVFFGAIALHFFPTLLRLDDAYAPGALRSNEWNGWLFAHFWRVPRWALHAGATATMLACGCAIVGLRTRWAAIVCGVGCYVFASFNARYVQTLAIVNAWAILLAWMICGGGDAAWSVEAWLARRRRRRRTDEPVPVTTPPTPAPAREPRLLSALIVYQALLAVFFSGVEKLLAGWPLSNEMRVVLSYPPGFMLRDWAASIAALRTPVVTHALTWLTLVVELGAPPCLLFARTRRAALIAYELFFLGIVALLEVPPLFWFIFAFGALLALEDHELGFGAAPTEGEPAAPARPETRAARRGPRASSRRAGPRDNKT